MKTKNIKLNLTTGKTITVDEPGTGFLLTQDKIYPLADWNVNDAFQAMADLMLSTLSAQVDNYGTYKPLFDKFEETVSEVKQQLSKETWAKEFAYKYQQAFLIDEVMEDSKLPEDKRQYKELFDKMIDFSKRAAEKLNESNVNIQ